MTTKVLVTGASGFVGSHVVKALAERKISTHVLLRQSSSVDGLRGLSVELRHGSLSNQDSLREAVRGVDVVIHVAGAVTAPSREAFFEHNAEGTRRLLEAIAECAPDLKRFLLVSSLAAAGPSLDGNPRSERDVSRAVSAYGESKYAGERYVQNFAERFPCLIVRPPMVYGPRDRGVLTIAQAAAKGWMPLLPSEPPIESKIYSQIYGEDLARGIVELALSAATGWTSGEAFYLSSHEHVTQEQIFQTMAEALEIRLRRVSVPAWAIRVAAQLAGLMGQLTGKSYPLNPDKVPELLAPAWLCSSERAKQVFGFQARTSFRDGIFATVKWYREQGWI